MKKINTFILAVYFSSAMPSLVFAAGKIDENQSTSIVAFLELIRDWILGFAGAAALFFIVYGGFLYMTSSGNQQKLEVAKKTLTYAILGLLLIILSRTILEIISGNFLPNIFGNNTYNF